MADIRKKVADNVDGDFFVDTTCINCDTCRQLASSSFEDGGDYSRVYRQPLTDIERKAANHALISCPTGSIGNTGQTGVKEALQDFPLPIEDGVYYCGFNSPKSYGGNSFLILDKTGNWLIDSPKYNSNLIKKLEDMGGIKYIFLTHEDDVADAKKYAKHFKAARIIHKYALDAQADAEVIIEGESTIELEPGFKVIPTPGHTRGHIVLLLNDKFLFTGDHLYLNRDTGKLGAHERHCWYSFEEQTRSMQKLLDYNFQWILAGHGDRGKLDQATMKKELNILIDKMKNRQHQI